MDQTKTIFFIGKPGCGKGTQAKLLSEHTGWPVFGSGQQLRAIASEPTHLGRKVKEEIDAGMLSPHWFVMYLYQRALFSIDDQQSAIFDGFNRKVPEAELTIASHKWLGRPFQVIEVVISDEEALKRIAIRREQLNRADDQFVPERLKEYEKFTKDAIVVFEREGVLIKVDGERPPEIIAEDIRQVLHV
jgi:adenylate kinase